MFETYETTFKARAAAYQRAMETLPEARACEFQAVVDPLDLERGQTVCDMPSGGGYLHRYLPEDVNYLAVEPVADFFANCPSGARARAVQSPIESVALPDQSVDKVVSLAGLHHCLDLSLVFAEMKRIVRPGGQVVIADVQAGSRPAHFLNGYVAQNNPMGHDGRFLGPTTLGLLQDAGLEPLDDRIVDIPWRFDTERQAGWYCAELFGIEGLSPEEVAKGVASEVGASWTSEVFSINWQLRRIVCRA